MPGPLRAAYVCADPGVPVFGAKGLKDISTKSGGSN